MNRSIMRLQKSLIYILLGICLSHIAHGQVNLDSLWGVWNNNTKADSIRADAIHKIAQQGYLFSQPDSAFYYAQVLYDFAQEKNLKMQMANAFSTMGASYYVRSKFPKALEYYGQSYDIYNELSDNKSMARMLNNMGVIHSILGDFPKALDYYQQSLQIKEEISDKSGMAGAMNNIGLIYMNHGNYPRALDYFQRSLKIKEEFSDKAGIAQTLNNIGLIYMKQNDTTKALVCFQRSMQLCEEISDRKGMAGILSNIGLIYAERGDYSHSLEYYQQSLEIKEEISDRKGLAETFNNIGEIYFKQGDYQKAKDYYQRCRDIYEDIADKKGLAGVYINIGRIGNRLGNFKQAIAWCDKGLQTSEDINILEEQRDACQCLYDAYKAEGNSDQALVYHERIVQLNDSLQAEETAKELQQMEFSKQVLADSLIREEEKLMIQMKHEAEVRRKNMTRNIFIISAVFLLLGAFGLYRRMTFTRRAKKAIESEKERSDKLLLNILPSEIAEELKEKGRADARNFENVSILFTDFSHFTEISEKLSAKELVGEINTCFEQFDSICQKYGIEKIKTMGDSYMAAGGLPIPSDDAAIKTVMAGLEMAECMIKHKKELDAMKKVSFEMRVGIHTGPVVAGIVGTSKFQYDIWGDTVNTASRIESSGEVGKVNISAATYEAIKDDPSFNYKYRGKVQTKGKGEIEMWFVERAFTPPVLPT
jgi:class 3 adenylate cyclase/Tfp pilus assembly protein PilF